MTTRSGEPLAADASLHLLADHLTEALAAGELAPCLLHVGGPDVDGFDLGVLPLDGRHPTELLLGTTAPPEWHAVGMATSGWAYHVTDRADPQRRRHRVHVVSLVSRTGEHAHRTHAEDEEISAALERGEAPEGEQVDLLRRALGLPTAPPPVEASAYWTIQWLTELTSGPPAETVQAAIDRHPAVRLLSHGVRGDDHEVGDVIAAFHRVLTWSRLRALAAVDRFEVPELAPSQAAWLDDGAFARFVLNRCPPLHVVRARLRNQAAWPVAAAVDELLERLDVPDFAWPDIGDRPAA